MRLQLLVKYLFYTHLMLIPFNSTFANVSNLTQALRDLQLHEANVGTAANTTTTPSITTPDKNLHSSIVNLEGMPSAMVNNCVNVISGDYSEMQEDLVVPGPQPIVIRRGYSSASDNEGYYLFSHGWNLNHHGYMYISEEKELPYEATYDTKGYYEMVGTGKYTAKTTEGYGVELQYLGSPQQGFTLDPCIKSKNLTNCGSGEISGRTNLCNTRIHKANKKDYHMTLGSGLVRVLSPQYSNASCNFHLREERYPSGNKLKFNYSYEHTHIKKITAQNALGDVLGYVEFDQKNPQKLAKGESRVIRAHSSNGKTVKYGYTTLEDEDFLAYVERPNAPKEHYAYQRTKRCERGRVENIISHQLISKTRPDGRFKQIEYYNNKGEEYKVARSSVTLTGSSPFLGRVKCLKAPVGIDNKPVVTHSFIYYGEEYKVGRPMHTEKKIWSGYTDVYDAYNRPTRYSYGCDHRLESIEKVGIPTPTCSMFPVPKRNVYCKDSFHWNSTNLQYRVFTSKGKVYFWRHYLYDKFGNITEERLYGNLTGDTTKKIKFNPGNKKSNKNGEVFSKKYKYLEVYNLPIEEDDGRKITTMKYYPNSELLQQRFIKDGEKICQRQFFEYDSNAVLIKQITDDGCSEDKNDLTNVTERHIKCIQPSVNIPMGFPEIIEEKYLNLLTGNEELLRKVVNSYSTDGYLLRQDHYDSNNQYVHASYWEYDEKGNVILETNALGETIAKDYDKNGNLIYEKRSGTDSHKEMTYDFANRLIRAEDVHSDGLRLAVCYKYNLMSQKISSKDIYGNETKYVYDYFGRLIEVHHPAVPNEQGTLIQAVEKTEYNALNHPVSQTDALGNVTKTAFTTRGKPYHIEYPDGSNESCRYTLDGLLERSVAKNGVTTLFEYDYLGRVISTKVTSPSGELLHETSAIYNAFHLLSETDAAGTITRYTYDQAGRLTQVSKDDRLTISHYDSLGRVAKTLEYFGYDEHDYTVNAQEYDLLNRVIQERTEDAHGNILKKAEYSYDADGNRCETRMFNQAGIGITTTTYSPYHEPELITDPYGNVTRTITDYSYFNEFNQAVARKDIVDALGNTTVAISDVRGRVAMTYRKNILGEITQKKQFFYDANGNRVHTLDTVYASNVCIREVVSTYEYDTLNRLIHTIEALGTSEQKQTRICYNAYGQKEMVVKPDGIILFHEYDLLGHLTSFRASDDSFHYTYSYDQRYNLISVNDEKTNIATSRFYDTNNRLVSEILGNGLETCYSYDRMGRPLTVTFPDQSGMSYVYQTCFLKEVRRLSKDNDNLYAHTYNDYDLTGSVTSEMMIKNCGKTSYQYDLLGRTLKIDHKHWQETVPSNGFDNVGNLLEFSISDAVGKLSSHYTYDDLYQLKSEQGTATHKYNYDSLYNCVEKDEIPQTVNNLNQLLSDAKSTYSYDLSGNLLQKGSDETHYAYDALNRLVSVTKGYVKTCYTYDAFNRRLDKIEFVTDSTKSNWVQSHSTRYFYHGQNEIGACNAGGVITELRLLGSGRGAEIGAAIAIELNGKVFAPLHDHNGNVRCLIDAKTGKTKETYRYSAFGEEQIFDGVDRQETAINPWRFSSKRVDKESNLVYFGHRYYDPETARWLTPDPMGECAGPNLYAYVNNSPLTHFDAYGLWIEAPVARPDEKTHFRSPRQDYDGRDSERSATLEGIGFVASLPGNLIEGFGQHFVPIPFIGDGIELLGRVLARKSLRDYVPTFRRPGSRHYYIAGVETLERRLLLENGICTSLETITNKSIAMSEFLGGARVDFVHNASRGFLCDVLTTLCQKLKIPTPSAQVSQEAIQYCLDQVGKNGIVFIGAHSQGGQIINYNLHKLDKDVTKQLEVSIFGAPCIIAEGMASKVTAYISTRDGVPLFSNIDYVKAKMNLHTHVVFIKSSGYPFIDHSFDYAYDKPLKDFGNSYRESCAGVSK